MTPSPVFAETSWNFSPYRSANSTIYYFEIYRIYYKSDLLAKRQVIEFFGWWSAYSCIHPLKLCNDSFLEISNTKTTQLASRRYAGTKLLYFSWPAVSHSWSRYVWLFKVIFRQRKSIPMVGLFKLNIHCLQFRTNLLQIVIWWMFYRLPYPPRTQFCIWCHRDLCFLLLAFKI